MINEVTDLGEVFNVAIAAVDFTLRETHNRAVEIDVIAAGELLIETGAEFEKGRDTAIDLHFARGRPHDAGHDLKRCTFA